MINEQNIHRCKWKEEPNLIGGWEIGKKKVCECGAQKFDINTNGKQVIDMKTATEVLYSERAKADIKSIENINILDV